MASAKKNYTLSVPVAVFWKIIIPSVILAAIAGILIVDEYIMPKIVGVDRDLVVVPPIIGMDLEQGREKLFSVGLLTEIRSRDYDPKVPYGSIISQNPASSEKVKKGRRILVSVSKGKEFAVVPDIRKLTERQAKIELKKKGFTLGEVKRTFHEEVPADQIIESFPAVGATISRDMKVDLSLSKGQKPTSVEMPNIVGESLAEAKKKIEESGLRVGKITYKNDASLLPGTVVSQSVSPGENAAFETAVSLTVSVVQ